MVIIISYIHFLCHPCPTQLSHVMCHIVIQFVSLLVSTFHLSSCSIVDNSSQLSITTASKVQALILSCLNNWDYFYFSPPSNIAFINSSKPFISFRCLVKPFVMLFCTLYIKPKSTDYISYLFHFYLLILAP